MEDLTAKRITAEMQLSVLQKENGERMIDHGFCIHLENCHERTKVLYCVTGPYERNICEIFI